METIDEISQLVQHLKRTNALPYIASVLERAESEIIKLKKENDRLECEIENIYFERDEE